MEPAGLRSSASAANQPAGCPAPIPGLDAALLAGTGVTTDQAGQVLLVVASSLGIKQAPALAAARRARRRSSRDRSLLASTLEGVYAYVFGAGKEAGELDEPGVPLAAGRHLLQLSSDPATAMAAQSRLQSATDLLHQAVTGLSASIDPTQVLSVSSSGLSAALRAELRADMAGRVLEAGPDASSNEQPDSPTSVRVMLPDSLDLPAAACVDDGAGSCLEPPALLRLDAYASLTLFMDVLTNGLLANSSSANYSSVVPLSAVANIGIPTHLAPGEQLACTSGDACLMALHLPLVAEPVAGANGTACVELVQLGGLVSSELVAYPADITTTASGAVFATCRVPKVGTFLALQYVLAPPPPEPTPEVLVIETGTTTSSTPGPQPWPPAKTLPDTPPEPSDDARLNIGQTAAVVIGSVASFALLVGGLVIASRAGLIPPIGRGSSRRQRYAANADFDDAVRASRDGSVGGRGVGGLAPPPPAVLASGPAGLAGAEEYGVPRQTGSPEPPEPAWPAARGGAAAGEASLPQSTRSSQPVTPRDEQGGVVEAAAFVSSEAAAGEGEGEGVSYGRLRAAAKLDDIPLEIN
jgi:hypothetical protein